MFPNTFCHSSLGNTHSEFIYSWIFFSFANMDVKDMEKQDPISGVIEKTASLDEKKFRNMITSPQQTPRFTDSYAAALYHTPECYESSPSPHPVTNLEDADSMPTSDSEPSDIHGSQSVDPEDEVDDDDACEDLYRNPDPPKELVEQHLVDADNIGNTVFSKHWVFTTLMNLLKVCSPDRCIPKGRKILMDSCEEQF